MLIDTFFLFFWLQLGCTEINVPEIAETINVAEAAPNRQGVRQKHPWATETLTGSAYFQAEGTHREFSGARSYL